jgi:hypothetical protein
VDLEFDELLVDDIDNRAGKVFVARYRCCQTRMAGQFARESSATNPTIPRGRGRNGFGSWHGTGEYGVKTLFSRPPDRRVPLPAIDS